MILSAVYMLWMVQRVFYGPVTNEKNATLPDLSVREWCAAAPLVAAAILMGVLPTLFLRPMEPVGAARGPARDPEPARQRPDRCQRPRAPSAARITLRARGNDRRRSEVGLR